MLDTLDVNSLLTDEKLPTLKSILQSDFRTYLDIMFYVVNGSFFVWQPFHEQVVAKLQEYADCKNIKRNLCINIPVGAGKSIIVEYWITWCFCRSKDHTFCYVSHSDRLINRLSKEAKDIVLHPFWTKVFSEELKKDDRSRVNWSFSGAAGRTGLTAGTMGGGLTGLDAGNPNKKGFPGALVIDDPVDAGDIVYPATREECCRFYDDKLATRRRSPRTPTIIIMQRLHKEDLTGWLLDKEPDLWDVMIIPALQEDGTSFWENKYPIDELAHIERINPVKFNAQYQQNPITCGGQVIQSKWFRYFPIGVKYNYKRLFITGDTAMKVKEHNDYSVFLVCAITDYGKLHILDMLRGKWEAPDLKRTVKGLWNKWVNMIDNCCLSALYIEDKASGTGLIQDIRTEGGIPVIPIIPDKDKLTRVESVISHIEAGNVELPQSRDYGFNNILISECESFTRDDSHKYDDIVDALVYSIMQGLSRWEVSILDVL